MERGAVDSCTWHLLESGERCSTSPCAGLKKTASPACRSLEPAWGSAERSTAKEPRWVRVASLSRRCSASELQPPKKNHPGVFSRCVGSIKKTEIAILQLERNKKKRRNSVCFQKCMFTSGSVAPPPVPHCPTHTLSSQRPYYMF